MSTEQIELRLAAIESTLAEVRDQLNRLTTAQPKRWWELQSSFSPQAVGAMLDEIDPYTKYVRQTGESPPPGWNPGDPIPEPDHWK